MLAVGVMLVLAVAVERVVLRPLVNQPDIILFMATFGLTYFLIGLGELIFGGNPKQMIASQLYLPQGATDAEIFGGAGPLPAHRHRRRGDRLGDDRDARRVLLEDPDRPGAARRRRQPQGGAVGRHLARTRSGSSSGSRPGIVALVTGIMWGARSDVSFALQIIALKALPVLILGGFTSIPGAIVGGLIIGIGEKIGEFYWGPLVGGGIETWLAYVIALLFLLYRPQGLFGEKIIERI